VPGIIFYGIFSGRLTPTEAGATAVIVTIIIGFVLGTLKLSDFPNSLPEIFTGARVAMGVCWGTVVAAELVAAEKGAGMMIMVASKFQQTDIVILGIILIGIIGFGIDMLMRWVERVMVPWKGRG
jgi:ABC-type proline/glycine betaine transport system permease subunit